MSLRRNKSDLQTFVRVKLLNTILKLLLEIKRKQKNKKNFKLA